MANENTNKNQKLSDYTDRELSQELERRGFTVLSPVEPMDFADVDWPEVEPFPQDFRNNA